MACANRFFRNTNIGIYEENWQKILGSIYDSAVSPENWAQTVNELADFCGLGVGSLVIVDHGLQMARVSAPRADPEVIADYDRHWWAKDPSIGDTRDLPVGQVHVMNPQQRETFLQSQYYNDYWRHSGMGAERICTNLMTFSNDAFANLTLLAPRQNDTISNHAHAAFRGLVPHLVRAIELSSNIQMLALERQLAKDRLAEQALFAIPVDRLGRPVVTNAETEHALRSFSFLRLKHGILTLRDTHAANRLARMIHRCAKPRGDLLGETIHLPDHGAEPGATIKLVPWQAPKFQPHFAHPEPPVALLIVSAPDEQDAGRPDTALFLQETYELTPAEIRVAQALVKGGGREAVARRLGISLATVRTHLSRIFEKTGVRRQSELVAIVLALPRHGK